LRYPTIWSKKFNFKFDFNSVFFKFRSNYLKFPVPVQDFSLRLWYDLSLCVNFEHNVTRPIIELFLQYSLGYQTKRKKIINHDLFVKSIIIQLEKKYHLDQEQDANKNEIILLRRQLNLSNDFVLSLLITVKLA
jgi:hypothetical protein